MTGGAAPAPVQVTAGTEWVIDALGCAPATLRSVPSLRGLLEDVIRELALTPAADPIWKVFPGEAGVTGMWMLQESHLTVHTFPEHATAAINLYCCTERRAWAWGPELRRRLGATEVRVRVLGRGAAALADPRFADPDSGVGR
jgi:S-adenosylmethionine decarboxylase